MLHTTGSDVKTAFNYSKMSSQTEDLLPGVVASEVPSAPAWLRIIPARFSLCKVKQLVFSESRLPGIKFKGKFYAVSMVQRRFASPLSHLSGGDAKHCLTIVAGGDLQAEFIKPFEITPRNLIIEE